MRLNRLWGIALVAALSAVGCAKKEDKPAPPAPKMTDVVPAKPEAKELTAADRQKIFDDCWAAVEAKNVAAFKACYAPSATFELVDAVPPRQGTGGEAASAIVEAFRAAMPDLKHEQAFLAIHGDKVAAFYITRGTHTGPLMGLPPTQKPIAIWAAQHAVIGADGKVMTDKHWQDGGTLMAQLGVSPNPMAPGVEDAVLEGERVVVLAKGDDTEKANLGLIAKIEQAAKSGQSDAMLALYADDAEFRFLGDKNVVKGKEAMTKALAEWTGMHSEMAPVVHDAWAAGDWLIAETGMKGTLAIDLPGAPAKTKGKSYESRYLEFMQIADGKIAKHWIFTDGSKQAAALGLFDPSKLGGAQAPPQ